MCKENIPMGWMLLVGCGAAAFNTDWQSHGKQQRNNSLSRKTMNAACAPAINWLHSRSEVSRGQTIWPSGRCLWTSLFTKWASGVFWTEQHVTLYSLIQTQREDTQATDQGQVCTLSKAVRVLSKAVALKSDHPLAGHIVRYKWCY